MLVFATPALVLALLLQQEPAPISPAAMTRTDSVRIVRVAQSAQSAFEAFRRNRLPTSWSSGGGGSCETRIGRYCYWRGDEDEDDTPPFEAPAIRERRDELLRTLDSAARRLPGDEWLAAQRVRYLVESDRTDDAMRTMRDDCRATASWCSALAGYAAHVAGRYSTADSAYSAALAAMDSAQRCRWFDISDLLSDELERRFKALDCAGREAFVRRLFRLGAPLYSVATTDLLTEHFARVTRARMSEHSATTDGEGWGDDMRELVLRYGWPRWHSRSAPQFGWEDRPSITGHDAGVPYYFLPSIYGFDHIGHLTPSDWALDDPRAGTGYAPPYARSIHQLPHQLAVFRRDDSSLVIAAWDARGDTTLVGRRLNAALVLVGDTGRPIVARTANASIVGRIAAIAAIDSGVASLELMAPADRRATRARVGVPSRTTDRLALSDLLLYAPGASSPDSLAAVSDSTLPTDVVAGARALGVFWEAYGLRPEGESVEFALSVEQVDVDWMHRAAASLHLADPASELRVRWQETPQQMNGVAARGVRLDLSRLRSGRYRIELAVAGAGGSTAIATREIQVR